VVSEGAWREACVCKAVCVGSRGAQPAAAQERLTAGAGRVSARSLAPSVRRQRQIRERGRRARHQKSTGSACFYRRLFVCIVRRPCPNRVFCARQMDRRCRDSFGRAHTHRPHAASFIAGGEDEIIYLSLTRRQSRDIPLQAL
jgi:hypothetical protein